MKEKNEKFDYTQLAPIVSASKSAHLPVADHPETKMFLVFSRHRYYRHLVIDLISAPTTKSGKLKNPLTFLDPLGFVWKKERHDEIKFFAGKFWQHS